MKTNILRFVTVAFAAVVMCSVPACEDPIEEPGGSENNGNENTGNNQEVAVNFPDLVENYEVKPGETLELTFTPSKEWTVSVPSETIQWFWIADGSFKLDKFSGTASEEAVTVKIGVSGTEEFDTNRSCDVTLTIGDESKVIAKYMRPAKERTLAVYMAELSETGDYKLAEDGVSYVYGAEATSAVTLVWSAANADFRAPIRVESNGEWTAVYPEWITLNVPEKTTGVVELVITGESLESASGKISFKSGDNVIKEVDVSVPSCKGVDVYSASVSEGEFEYDENGEYSWTDKSVSEVTLAWLGADFRMPLKISSKCNWTLSLPEWLSAEVPAATAGEITFTLLGVPSKYPLEDASGKIVFKSGETPIHEITVTIPGCKDILTYNIDMALTELDFNAAGDVMTSTGYADVDVTASIFGTSKTNVYAFEIIDGKYVIDSAPEWLDVNVAAFNTADGAHVLQDRKVTVSVEENTGGDRKAVLFFAPHSLYGNPSAAFNEGLTEVKEEYVKYIVPVTQLSNKFVVTINSTEDAMTEAGVKFEPATDEKKSELTAAFGQTDQVYVLTYDNIYALDEARMSMSRSFASVKIFDNAKTDQSAVEDFWLAFDRENNVVKMYSDIPLPTAPSTGYVVFYDESGAVLAIIECISPYETTETDTPPVDEDDFITDGFGNVYYENSSYFTDAAAAAAAGAKLYEVVSGRYYEQYKEFQCPILILEYSSSDTEAEIKLPSEIAYWNVYDGYGDYITVNGKSLYNTLGILTKATDEIRIKMTDDVYNKKDEIESVSTNKKGGLKITLHKNMTTQNPTLVVFCRMNLEN